MKFKQYKRTNIVEMAAYEDGSLLSSAVSITQADKENGSPKAGDMIARNPENHEDMWLVTKNDFAANFEVAPQTFKERLVIEVEELETRVDKLRSALSVGLIPESAIPDLNKQLATMTPYLEIVSARLQKLVE